MGSIQLAVFPNGYTCPVSVDATGREVATVTEETDAQRIIFAVVVAVYLGIPLTLFLALVVLGCFRDRALLRFKSQADEASKVDTPADLSSGAGLAIYPVFLSFSGVRYEVISRGTGEPLELLKGISAYFAPGTMSAIMGPSGCGKSTLLDVLSNRKTTGTVYGSIMANGKVVDWSLFKQAMGYVQQSDCLLPRLTVRETLTYIADFTLSASLTLGQRKERVDLIISLLGLQDQADMRIGESGASGALSGGQKRRLTIGTELIALPSVLFLDEPTSGLDAYGSLQVVKVLKDLAAKGHTVVLTIHQPRADIFSQFDQLLLLKSGETMYFGPTKSITSYFSAIGLRAVLGQNPAEFIVDLTHDAPEDGEDLIELDEEAATGHDIGADGANFQEGGVEVLPDATHGHRERAEGDRVPTRVHVGTAVLVEKYATSQDFAQTAKTLDLIVYGSYTEGFGPPLEQKFSSEDRYFSSPFRQIFILTHRALLNDSRTPSVLSSFILGGVTFLFYGLLYVNVPSPQQGTREGLADSIVTWQSRVGIIYQTLAAIIFAEQSMVSQVYFEKALFFREHFNGTYGSFPFHVAWGTRLMFMAIVKGLLYTPIFYFLSQFVKEAEPFFLYMIIMILCSAVGSSIALLCACASSSFRLASAIFTLAGGLANSLSGYFLSPALIPPWFIWLYYVNYFKYALEGAYTSQIGDAKLYDEVPVLGNIVQVNGYFNKYTNILVLLFFPALFHLAAFAATYRVTHRNDVKYVALEHSEAMARSRVSSEASVNGAAAEKQEEYRHLERASRLGVPSDVQQVVMTGARYISSK